MSLARQSIDPVNISSGKSTTRNRAISWLFPIITLSAREASHRIEVLARIWAISKRVWCRDVLGQVWR